MIKNVDIYAILMIVLLAGIFLSCLTMEDFLILVTRMSWSMVLSAPGLSGASWQSGPSHRDMVVNQLSMTPAPDYETNHFTNTHVATGEVWVLVVVVAGIVRVVVTT